MNLFNLDDFKSDFENKIASVFLRCDLNITENDFTRIDLSLPTIKELLGYGFVRKLIICTHIGRPHNNFDPNLSVKTRIKPYLEKKLGILINFVDLNNNNDVEKLLNNNEKSVYLAENIRFIEGEISNSPELIGKIKSFSNVYINDAFGSSHRKHASVYGISRALKSYSGRLLEKETDVIDKIINSKDITLILGGAKIEDKIGIMMNLADKVQNILIGGGMVSSFLTQDFPKTFNKEIYEKNIEKFVIPKDIVVTKEFSPNSASFQINANNFNQNTFIVDIGAKTSEEFSEVIKSSEVIIWNGSMGVFEWEFASAGTLNIIKNIAMNNSCKAYAGGGSTIEAINLFGSPGSFEHISSGGGAFLELLESGTLIGIDNLKKL